MQDISDNCCRTRKNLSSTEEIDSLDWYTLCYKIKNEKQ